MSRLDDLIRELCPDGVEFKELGDKSLFHFHYGKGNKIPKNGGAYPVYGCNGIVSSTDTYNCENVSIIGHIGSAGIVNWCSGKAFVTYNGTIADIKDKSKLDSRYLYYVLLSLNLPTYVKGSQPFLSASDFAKVRIPIPPLEVQQEIVRLLDDFTAKTAELQAELNKEYEARKKQYEYYRDTLLMQKSLFINNNKTTDFLYDIELICSKVNVELSKDPEIKEQQCSYYKEIIKTYNETGKIPSSLEQTKKMSIIKIIQYLYGYANVNLLDVANNYTGLTYKPSDKADYGTLVLRSSNIVNNRLAYDDNVFVQMETIPQRAIAKENDILVCVRNGSRALIGKSAIIPHTQTPMAFGAFMTVLRANPTLLNYKYLYFVWQTNYVQNLIHGDEAMPINQITNKEFKRIHFALPTLNEQNALVQKLEKLEETSFELQSNISVELESRQKQYEFYRDKLLTFKELN